jgi:hypothetical protein
MILDLDGFRGKQQRNDSIINQEKEKYQWQ